MNYTNIAWWRKGFVLSATFLLLLLVTTTSCKKDKKLLGGNAIDQNELLNSGGVDTFSLVTYTIEQDSILSDNPSRTLLGTYNDPEFGSVDAGFYTQIKLSGLSPNFGDLGTIVVDSFIMALEYEGGYGSAYDLTLEVFEVDEQMYLDSTYYSHEDLAVQSTNWINPGNETLTIDPNNLTVVGDDTLNPQLRIPLKPSIGKQILDDSQVFTAEYADNNLFSSNYLKGLRVKTTGVIPPSGSGIVAYFDLISQFSKLTIYYTQDGVQKFFDLNINSNCADYNRVTVDNTGKNVENVVATPSLGQTEFYAQAFKSRAVVELPTLQNLPKNIIVHTAQLHLPVQYLSSSSYTPGTSISVLTKNSLDLINLGTYSPGSKEFTVDLRQYVQAFVAGAVDQFQLLVSPSSYTSSTDRIVFNGPNTTNKSKPRLVITYTEF